MKHEPECPNTPTGICFCGVIDRAYLRAREDAMKAVEKVAYKLPIHGRDARMLSDAALGKGSKS